MAPPLEYNFSFRKVFLLLLSLALFFFSSSVLLISASSSSLSSSHSELQTTTPHFIGKSRRLLEAAVGTEEDEEEEKPPPKKKTNTNISPPIKKTNQTKLIKPKTSNSTKSTTPTSNLTKTQFKNPKNSTSNSTKTSSSSSSPPSISTKTLIKKLNSTSKSSNSTKPSSKSSDLLKLSSPTTKTIESKNQDNKKPKSPIQQKTSKPTKKPTFLDQQDEEDEDLITEFRDLPSRFQDTVLPDWFKISKTSKLYLKKANNDLTKGFKPYVGNKYAPTIATLISCTFLLLPLFLVSLIFHHFKSYFSLQKILIFIQVYLSIYFSILSLSSLVTGLEPLKFFYATSQSTYVWLQVLQTLGYVLYLLLLLMYLILVFSTDCGLGEKLLGLGQTFVGFAVGLHYYVSVFHRVVLYQPPKTNWKVHGIYATCFFVICLFARAERRKKAYLEEGGEEGKKN